MTDSHLHSNKFDFRQSCAAEGFTSASEQWAYNLVLAKEEDFTKTAEVRCEGAHPLSL